MSQTPIRGNYKTFTKKQSAEIEVFIFGITVSKLTGTVKCYENTYWYGAYVIITPSAYQVD